MKINVMTRTLYISTKYWKVYRNSCIKRELVLSKTLEQDKVNQQYSYPPCMTEFVLK